MAQSVHNQLFSNRNQVTIYNRSYPVQHYEGGRVKSVTIGFYTFLTQNPNKPSKWGVLARQGHQITWVLRGNNYLARVDNGVFTSV